MTFVVSISIVYAINMMCGWLQDCGHVDFCFACVQGLTSCPTCSTTIEGGKLSSVSVERRAESGKF